MTTDAATKIISKYESLVVLCTYNILFTNDICCGQVIESLHAMKRTPYYRQAFKRYLNDADKARKEYERTVKQRYRFRPERVLRRLQRQVRGRSEQARGYVVLAVQAGS
ncbi:hypothetical protein [Bacteroides clarus]|uniref:hypothetical protein n=1 Tax=Bacteroides clarus TaxID=626929 RepID=UPI00189A992B|nr:hypothetical protein [Bacteroides clarus]